MSTSSFISFVFKCFISICGLASVLYKQTTFDKKEKKKIRGYLFFNIIVYKTYLK